MPVLALALVLTGAALHALWNIAAKKAGGDARFSFYSGLVTVCVWAPLTIYLGWHTLGQWSLLAWGLASASGLVHWVYFYCLLTGYRKSDLTVVYPVARGSGPLMSSCVAIVLFGEHVGLLTISGIAAVVFGVFMIAGGPKLLRAAHDQDPARQRLVRAGLGWGLLTGMLIASYTVLDAWAIKVVALSPILYDYFCNLLRLPYAAVPVLKDPAAARTQWRTQWPYALAVGVLSPAAYVCVLFAVRIAPVSHIAPAREVSMLIAALLGGHLLGEADRGPRLLGALCVAMGVVALALA